MVNVKRILFYWEEVLSRMLIWKLQLIQNFFLRFWYTLDFHQKNLFQLTTLISITMLKVFNSSFSNLNFKFKWKFIQNCVNFEIKKHYSESWKFWGFHSNLRNNFKVLDYMKYKVDHSIPFTHLFLCEIVKQYHIGQESIRLIVKVPLFVSLSIFTALLLRYRSCPWIS